MMPPTGVCVGILKSLVCHFGCCILDFFELEVPIFGLEGEAGEELDKFTSQY